MASHAVRASGRVNLKSSSREKAGRHRPRRSVGGARERLPSWPALRRAGPGLSKTFSVLFRIAAPVAGCQRRRATTLPRQQSRGRPPASAHRGRSLDGVVPAVQGDEGSGGVGAFNGGKAPCHRGGKWPRNALRGRDRSRGCLGRVPPRARRTVSRRRSYSLMRDPLGLAKAGIGDRRPYAHYLPGKR